MLSSGDRELSPMTLTFELDQSMVKVNENTKCHLQLVKHALFNCRTIGIT